MFYRVRLDQAVIKAPWYRLRLPYYCRGFESHTIYAYWICNDNMTKINKKEAVIGPFL